MRCLRSLLMFNRAQPAGSDEDHLIEREVAEGSRYWCRDTLDVDLLVTLSSTRIEFVGAEGRGVCGEAGGAVVCDRLLIPKRQTGFLSGGVVITYRSDDLQLCA
ncbi:hypothetical protein Tco_1243614 [Tanacetum coccineum]